MALYKLQIKRDTAADFQTANTVLADGEFSLETDTGKMKVGNGSTAYNDLQFVTGDAATSTSVGYGGSTAGFYAHGFSQSITNPGGYAFPTEIRKMPFASDTSDSDHGDALPGLHGAGSWSSATHGITFGRATSPYTKINSFPFASSNVSEIDTGASIPISITGDAVGSKGSTAAATHSPTAGYSIGGSAAPAPTPVLIQKSLEVAKYTFASASTAATKLSQSGLGAVLESTGVPSGTPGYGYITGGVLQGYYPNAGNNVIQKHSFSNDAVFSDVGDLARVVSRHGAFASGEDGYTTGGSPSSSAPGLSNTSYYQKWPFASDSNASNLSALATDATLQVVMAGQDAGYSYGGVGNPGMPNASAGNYSRLTTKLVYSNDSHSTVQTNPAVGEIYQTGYQV
tara:strand:+ start:1282 stop:2478 length:1197 start_codon:yes stop_codon:yes gene_type:complete